MTHIKEQPRLRLPLPLPCTVTCSIIYFGRWVMLSGTSITMTLISPLELTHQYSWMSSQSRQEITSWLPDVFWVSHPYWELLVGLNSFFLFLNNKCVSNELSASPQGASHSVWHSLSFTLMLSFPAFTHIHPLSLRSSTVGEMCNFKSRILPLSFFACTLQQPPNLFFTSKGFPPSWIAYLV